MQLSALLNFILTKSALQMRTEILRTPNNQNRIKSLKMLQWDLVLLKSECLELYIVRITLNHSEVLFTWFCVYKDLVCIEWPHCMNRLWRIKG